MLAEHIIYSTALAILVGMVFLSIPGGILPGSSFCVHGFRILI